MKTETNLKQELYAYCLHFIEQRLKTVRNQIEDIQQSLMSETKSSAGDKHETGRAMLQLEREKAGHQLAEIEKLRQSLSKIDPTITSNSIGLGTVVFTTQANYFIAISAGKLEVNSQVFYAISPNTPIGLLLTGKMVGDEISFRDNKFVIERLE